MEHTPVRVSVCSQKGGVGKSSLTVLVASWLHYVMKRNVLVVDCDFPQWSIHTQRERELHVLEHSDYFKLMLLRQFRSSQRKLWPVVKTTPAEALDDAERFMAQERYAAELVLFDLPGTVGTEGVFSLACNMDYLFIPMKADKMSRALSDLSTISDRSSSRDRIACGRCVFSGQWSTVGSARRFTTATRRRSNGWAYTC